MNKLDSARSFSPHINEEAKERLTKAKSDFFTNLKGLGINTEYTIDQVEFNFDLRWNEGLKELLDEYTKYKINGNEITFNSLSMLSESSPVKTKENSKTYFDNFVKSRYWKGLFKFLNSQGGLDSKFAYNERLLPNLQEALDKGVVTWTQPMGHLQLSSAFKKHILISSKE